MQVREVRLHKLGPDSVTLSYTLVLQPGPGPLGLQVTIVQYALCREITSEINRRTGGGQFGASAQPIGGEKSHL